MKLIEKLKNFSVLAIVAAYLLTGCAATVVDNDSAPEAQFSEGERLLKKGRYLEAAERFRILKNRHPYSIYAVLATLKIGDVYYEQETFLEAASAYRVFRELYPKHEKADYALFRIGKSNFMLVPDSIDRDLSFAHASIKAFNQLEKKHPNSNHLKEARELRKSLLKSLAEKEMYVGNFYFVREMMNSAIGRYRNLLRTYSGFGFNREALERLSLSYAKLGKRTQAMEAFERYQMEFPKESHDNLKRDIEDALANPLSAEDDDDD